MKTNFKFYFFLIIGTAFISATVYGLGQPMVEKHITFFSFSVLAITVIGITGMMRSLVAMSPETVSAK